MLPAVALSGALLFLSGCGIKGPLYLPDASKTGKAPSATQPQHPSQPATGADHSKPATTTTQ